MQKKSPKSSHNNLSRTIVHFVCCVFRRHLASLLFITDYRGDDPISEMNPRRAPRPLTKSFRAVGLCEKGQNAAKFKRISLFPADFHLIVYSYSGFCVCLHCKQAESIQGGRIHSMDGLWSRIGNNID